MKALRHSPEGKIRRYADDEVITPYGLMTSLQVHVRGYVRTVHPVTGRVKSQLVEFRRGDGKETLFRDLGVVKNAMFVRTTANLMFTQYVIDPKMNSDGTPFGQERPKLEPQSQGGKPKGKFHKNQLKGSKPTARPFVPKKKAEETDNAE